MKKSLVLAAGLAILATSSFAQTQVLSRNAVGYVKIDIISSNKLHLIRHDFEPLGQPIAISNALASLPLGSQVILWDKANQIYRPAINKTPVGFGLAGSNRLERGMGFFIRSPNTATNVPSIPLYLMGEVPDKNTAPTTTINIANGLSMEGFPYPVNTKWTNTALAAALPLGAQLIIWNTSNQTYNAAINKTPVGWGVIGNAVELTPGMAFFVRSTSVVVYSQSKPYTWP